MPYATAEALGQALLALPACLLLAIAGLALAMRKDRLYALLTVAAVLWVLQTGMGAVVGGAYAWSQATGTLLPDGFEYWAPPVFAGGQTALNTLSWLAIGVAMLWPRSRNDDRDVDALPEDAVA